MIPFYLAGNIQRVKEVQADDDFVNASGLPYEFQFRKNDWMEDSEGFKLIIPASKHHRGLMPKCNIQIEDEGGWKDVMATISTDGGDVIIRVTSRIDGRAIIRA